MIYSIIIPIYNVASYIPRCFESIYCQGIDETKFEVLAINDGSTDNSSDVVKTYMKNHSNIHLFEKENGGVSTARNLGLVNSKGLFVLFVDPDDVIGPYCLQEMELILNNNPKSDVIIARSFTEEKENYKWVDLFREGQLYRATELINAGYLRGSVCGCLFNRQFLLDNNIAFIEGIRNGEDTNFMFQSLFHSNKFEFINLRMYHVVGREGSASLTYNRQRIDIEIESIKKIYSCCENFYSKDGNKGVLNYMLYSPISNMINDSLLTHEINHKYLKKTGIAHYCKFRVDDNLIYLRKKIRLLDFSFSLFYFLCWLKAIFSPYINHK